MHQLQFPCSADSGSLFEPKRTAASGRGGVANNIIEANGSNTEKYLLINQGASKSSTQKQEKHVDLRYVRF